MIKRILVVLLLVISNVTYGEVVILGDSIFAMTGEVALEFQRLSGREIISHAVTGATMEDIRTQYQTHRHPEITTVLMNGGANDVLQNSFNCLRFNDKCRATLDTALVVMEEMLAEMPVDTTVVWVGYYKPTGLARGFRGALDYATPLMQEACNNASLRCLFVDPIDAFADQSGLIQIDGLHPTEKGSRVLAALIWETFKEYKIKVRSF